METDTTAGHLMRTLVRTGTIDERDVQRQASAFAHSPHAPEAVRPAVELSVVVPTYSERENIVEVIRRLCVALEGVDWEVVFVDDDSPDGTAEFVKTLAQGDGRIRCIRRVGRRGLSGACVEGILSSAAPIVVVMDADLQHDETILPQMLRAIRSGADLVVATRYVQGGSSAEGFSTVRRWGSEIATRLANIFIGTKVSDPMSGFFMIRSQVIEDHAGTLASEGYKLLLDILWAAGKSLNVSEIAYRFRERKHGESKLDALVTVDYLRIPT